MSHLQSIQIPQCIGFSGEWLVWSFNLTPYYSDGAQPGLTPMVTPHTFGFGYFFPKQKLRPYKVGM